MRSPLEKEEESLVELLPVESRDESVAVVVVVEEEEEEVEAKRRVRTMEIRGER